MKKPLALLIAVSLCSCVSTPDVETSRLVVNEATGEFFLGGEKLSQKQAEEYMIKNWGSNEVVVLVERNKVGVYSFKEVDEFMKALAATLFAPNEQGSEPRIE